ncbi:MAG: SH3 domain-containing protein [Anaerolineales bacterium]|nr:SH3 domain-containing protein [Anaerolineales bacterium]MCA9930087.1 SH3 domain-containing protein [Anaerolineales bacterium]
MAKYQIPPDPRKSDERRSRRQRSDTNEPIPWLYLGLGVVVSIIGIVIAVVLANALLNRPPLPVSDVEPTIIVLTAPATIAPPATPEVATPTAVPTFTPVPTPDVAEAPDEITVGFYAQVANTDDFGVTVRGGPSTSNVPLLIADEGTVLLIIGGPEEAGGFLWWQVQLADGTEGWAAGSFLIPTAAP